MQNADSSLLPVKVCTVVTMARMRFNEVLSGIEKEMYHGAKVHIVWLEMRNKSFLCKIGIRKKQETHTPEYWVKRWTEMYESGDGILWYMAGARAICQTGTDWFKRLKLLASIVPRNDDEIMYMSLTDLALIKYTQQQN